MLEAGCKGAEGHRDVLFHLDLLNGASGAEGAEVKVLAGDGAGHQVAEACVADLLLRVLLQLLGGHQSQAQLALGHQQPPGEVVQLHRQLEDVPRHLEGVGPPVAVPVVRAAWKRGARGTGQGADRRVSSPAVQTAPGFLAFPFGLSSPTPSPTPGSLKLLC